MRVTVVGLNFTPEPTGIAPYTTGLARALAATGVEVSVVTGLPHYPQWRVQPGFTSGSSIEEGVRVTRVKHRVPAHPRLVNRLLMELDFGLRAVTSRWSRPEAVVLVTPALFATGLGVLRARLTRARSCIWVQDIYSLGVAESGTGGRMFGTAMRHLERRILRSGSTIVVIHDRFKRYLVEELGVDPSRVEVIRNWSHVERSDVDRDAARGRLGWGTDEVIVLHAGNMGAKQDLENVVRASRLADEAASSVRFVLLGDGNQRPALERLGGNSRLQFIDPVDDDEFMTTLAAADILLVNERPGLTEMSVPSKLTSYFATGRPVVAATDEASTTAEEMGLSGAGLRVAAADPPALLAAVEKLASDPASMERFGRSGAEFRESTLSVDAAMERFGSLLGSAHDRDAALPVLS